MPIKLFAHILRGTATAGGPAQPPAARPLDFGRWVLEELVVRRWEPLTWGLQQLLPPAKPPVRHDALPADSTWADTQPWCHE
jgi:hypothetical protein